MPRLDGPGVGSFYCLTMVTMPHADRPPQEDGVILAFDVGGTKLAAAVVDGEGVVLASFRRPTPRSDWRAAVTELIAAGRAALERVAGNPVAGGIACGGPLDLARELVLSPPNLPGWDEVPLVDIMEAEFGVPMMMDNDANAAALALRRWGPWAGVDDLVYLTVSSGIGSGIISGGQLLRGSAGNGAEAGHMPVRWSGRRCECGQRGCLEAYSSGTSIARRATEAVQAGQPSMLSALSQITAAEVARAASAGDVLALEIWTDAVDMLSMAVASLINVFEPRVILLGGGVTEAGHMLLNPVRARGTAHALSAAGRRTDVEITPFGRQIGVLGAAALAPVGRVSAVA